MLIENKVPRYGTTGDTTPTLRIKVKHPLPQDGVVAVLRDGVEIGHARMVDPLLYEYIDNVSSGKPEYVAEVRIPGLDVEATRAYLIKVLALNQAWSTEPNNEFGPFIVGAAGAKEWNGDYNDSFYIGVVGEVPPGTDIEFQTVWHEGSDGYNQPTLEYIQAVDGQPMRGRITAQSSNDGNYSSGVLDVTLVVNGIPMGDKLSLVLNDIPYGYEGATWAVWSAPRGTLKFESDNFALDDVSSSLVFSIELFNSAKDLQVFELSGVGNQAMEFIGEKYRIAPIFATAAMSRAQQPTVELRVKSGDTDTLVAEVDPLQDPLAIANFLFNGDLPYLDRFVRIWLRSQGRFQIRTQLEGDLWDGLYNGRWQVEAGATLSEYLQLEEYYVSSEAMSTRTTASSHDNPLPVQADGAWSWHDDAGNLLTFGANKFVTTLSNASVAASDTINCIVSLDGQADSGRIRLRWTATRDKFMRLTGDLIDVTSSPGVLVNIFKMADGERKLLQSGMKWSIAVPTQMKVGEYIEFEFFATTNDRTASRVMPYLEALNAGLT